MHCSVVAFNHVITDVRHRTPADSSLLSMTKAHSTSDDGATPGARKRIVIVVPPAVDPDRGVMGVLAAYHTGSVYSYSKDDDHKSIPFVTRTETALGDEVAGATQRKVHEFSVTVRSTGSVGQ